jgi:cyclopropane fatty-acyl-phospholipid synthase-like methyltransferase
MFEIQLRSEFPVASESPDHLMPWGTRVMNSCNKRFNEKLWRLYPVSTVVRVLDLGCGGGTFVRSCINDGHFAAGLEGSDFSKIHRRCAWGTIPNLLFTCDITKPFTLETVTNEGNPALHFDVVTAWDVLEHVQSQDLGQLIRNVLAHLVPGGLWIMSIATHEDVVGGVRLHQTVQSPNWWREHFGSHGLWPVEHLHRYFGRQYIRASEVDDEKHFHLVLTNDPAKVPAAPHVSAAHRLFDRWYGSRPQQLLRRLLV